MRECPALDIPDDELIPYRLTEVAEGLLEGIDAAPQLSARDLDEDAT